MKRNSILLLLLFAAAIFSGEPIKMHCYKVVDGDTIYGITEEGDTLKVRLWGIDCPEQGQPYGDSATQFVKERCEGKQVSIHKVNTDRYGRIVARVFFPFKYIAGHTKNIGIETLLLSSGLAWWDIRYAPDEEGYHHSMETAQVHNLGIWSIPRAIAPWEWRKMSKKERVVWRRLCYVAGSNMNKDIQPKTE